MTSTARLSFTLSIALLGCSSTRTVAPAGTTPPTAPAASLLAPGAAATYARFAVATDHPEASAAGAEVLAAGGTAADAAAAAMLALGVAGPASSGLGGGGFALYYRASDRSVTFLDFRETAPAAATAAMLNPPPAPAGAGDAGAPPTRAAGLAVGVPGEARGIEELLRRFGTIGRERVVAPAVRLAEEGFMPSEYMASYSQRFAAVLRRDTLGRAWVPEGSEGIRAGVRLRNPALAQTLRSFAAQGAQIFYEGALAEEIVRATRAAGGGLTLDDLRGYRVVERQPLTAERYGHRWVTAPPESAGGYTLLTSLGLLERWLPSGAARPQEVDVLHAMAESWRAPFIDRARYFGDPDFVNVPVTALMAPARLATRAGLFDMARARPSLDYDQPLPQQPAGAPAPVPVGSGTSHVCVVDAEGNVASVTTTINIPFGAGVSAGGFWLNNELDDFTAPGAPATPVPSGTANHPAPGRRPVSTMTPTIVFRGDDPVLCIGGSGGTRIVTSVVQAAWRTVVLGDPVGEAVAHPRIHQAAHPDVLSAEAGVEAPVVEGLRGRGHQTETLRFGAVVQAIRITRGAGGVRLDAASDPRKGGRPAGR